MEIGNNISVEYMESMIAMEIETYTKQSDKLCVNCKQLFSLEPSTIGYLGMTKKVSNVYIDQDECNSCSETQSQGSDTYEDFMMRFKS